MFELGVRPTRWNSLAILFAIALLAGGLPLDSARAAGPDGVVVYEGSMDRQDLVWESDSFDKIFPTLEGSRSLIQPGLPRLPVREMLLAVPLDYEVVGVVIEPLGTIREVQSAPVALAAPNVTSEGEMYYATSMDRSGDVFPAAWGTFTGSHVWRGYKLVSVDVYPVREFRTDAGTELEYLTDFAVRLVLDENPSDRDVAVRQRLVAGEAEDSRRIMASLVDNPDALTGIVRENGLAVTDKSGSFQPAVTPSLTGSAVTSLIITTDALAAEFQVLADFKTAQGLATVVSTVENIVSGNRNGADVQETIRMYIRDAYEKWGIEYVLLGGDSDILPPRYVNNSFYPTNGYTPIPVDLYFACLDGNWNANANDLFGQPASAGVADDMVDFAEEIYLGRATVSTPAAAAVFVSKNIAYETTPATKDWPNRALFAAEVLFPADWPEGNYITLDGAQYSDQQVNDYVIPCTNMEYTRMYQTDNLYPWDAPLNYSALVDTLNTGRYGIVNQIGHGYYFNMSVADRNFVTTDADQLTNGDNLFMIYALNCASGAFDNSCLLERFVQNPNGGSVCSLGSARAAFPNASNNYQQEFFAQLYCYGENRVGRLQALSRLPFIGSTSSNFVDRWTFENYTLLGDPTLSLWAGRPAGLTVGAPSGLALGPQLVDITVEDDGAPVADAQVCLAMGDEAFTVGFTDGAGHVALDFLPVSTGQAVLTVTGRNLELTTLEIPVTSGSSYLVLHTLLVTDDGTGNSLGNGNGVVEAGETVYLLPALRETGGAGAISISGVLSSADAGVVFPVDRVLFANVSAGGITSAYSPVTMSVDPAVADGTVVALQMEANGTGGPWFSEWSLEIKAPAPEVVDLDWDDSDWGNGNGILENGERVAITVRLKNYGTGLADLVSATLGTDESNVTLYDVAATWTDLGHLEEFAGSTVFSLSVADVLLSGASYIDFVDNHGRTFRHNFDLDRPVAPVTIRTDTSLGADVIALSWDPPAGDVLGYHVYRSLSLRGPYERVNADLVVGTSYFRDDNLNQLTRYFYQIATVDSSFLSSPNSVVISQSTAPAELTGFPLGFNIETSGHLAVGDVDGDGDKEIVLGADQIYVWHHDGLELLDGDNDSQTLGPFTGYPSDYGFSPAGITLSHLDDEAGLEMIVSEQRPGFFIHVYAKDGTEVPGWPQQLVNMPGTDWNWATPASGDIDGDGSNEVVVATLNGWIHAWHADGTEVRDGDSNPATNGPFYFRSGAQWEWSRSGPALYDLDGDGARDIIFGTRNDDTGLKRLMAIKYDGTDVAGFPYVGTGGIGCDPAVGDLDADGDVEIVFFDSAKYVHAVHHDGTPYSGFPVNLGYTSILDFVTSPALGDMDGDGMLEIIYTPVQSGAISRIVVLDTDYAGGTSGQVLAGFPVILPGSSEGSPVVGDIDGDQSPEILQGIGGGDENSPYNLYAYHNDGTQVDGFPITLTGPLMPSPVITDIDSDWDVDIVFGGWDFLVHVWDMPFAYDRRYVPWPTFGGNWRRDGNHMPLSLVPVQEGSEVPPAGFTVGRPYPNPFNPSTTLRLYIPVSGEVDLGVYDLQGRRVRTLHTGGMSSGWHTMVWDGKDDKGHGQASGLYFMRAKSSGEVSVRKMTLIKLYGTASQALYRPRASARGLFCGEAASTTVDQTDIRGLVTALHFLRPGRPLSSDAGQVMPAAYLNRGSPSPRAASPVLGDSSLLCFCP